MHHARSHACFRPEANIDTGHSDIACRVKGRSCSQLLPRLRGACFDTDDRKRHSQLGIGIASWGTAVSVDQKVVAGVASLT